MAHDIPVVPAAGLQQGHPGAVPLLAHSGAGFRRVVTYASLSRIARAITGTAWNGPRFLVSGSTRGPRFHRRDHDERRDHQQLVIVDVINDLRLLRDHGVECGASGARWTDSRTAR
jgi:Protein of unknown function (DUF2924)